MPELLDEVRRVRATARCIHEPAVVDAALDRMAAAISADLAEANPVVLCIMNGGLMLTQALLSRLDFPLTLDYLHATRYRGGTRGGEIDWRRAPSAALAGRQVLLVDDILDEGITLAAVIAALEALPVAGLQTALLVEKQHARKAPGARADYLGLTVPDAYVFGCGMDYKGYWRNLNGIWAVAA